MSSTATFLTSVLLLVTMTSLGFSGQDVGAYLIEKDGRKALKEPLSLREVQEGIAGKTAMVWTIEPSGAWRVARARSNKDGSEHLTPVSSGKMSLEQLEALAKVLADVNLTKLPEKTGHAAKVNPHEVILKFGQKTATLEGLPPRRNLKVAELIRQSAPTGEAAEAKVWERFAHVVQAVESHCQQPKTP
jgi:hypothetical protein